jgi:TonB family protein
MMTEKQNKLLGICSSLLLHAVVAVILIFSVSVTAMIARDPGKLDFVWVSISTKDKISFSPVEEESSQKTQSTATRTDRMPEISATQNFRVESGSTTQVSETTADDKTIAFPWTETVAYASAGSHSPVSDAGGQTVASGVAPAFSNAYPLYRENPSPGYPEMARQQGYEGVVLVQAEILADGRVGRAVISKSSGYAILDQTAIKAVMAWKFEPAKKSGIPCKTWAELPIKFVLNDRLS